MKILPIMFFFFFFQSNWPSVSNSQAVQLVPQTPPLNGQNYEYRLATPTKSGQNVQTLVSPLR